MRSRYLFITVGLIFALLIFGCSNTNNPITSSSSSDKKLSYDYLPVGITDCFIDGSIAGGMGTLGLFQLHLNPSNLTGELTSFRESSLKDALEVVDITNFLQLAPCTDCAKIKSVSLDADSHLVVSIGIRHPFDAGDPLKPITGLNRADLHVFNVEGIVVTDTIGTSFPDLGETTSGLKLLSADGYTDYLDDSLDEIFPTDASVHPYVLHFDDYSAGNFDPGNPMGFATVTDPPPSGNLVMAMGCDYNCQDYVFDLDSSVNLIFAVGCTYAVSCASNSQRFNPEYRVPQHNKKAASEVGIEIISNDLKGEDISSSAQIEVHVVDINHGVAVGDALNEMLADSSVKDILIEIPGVTIEPVVLDGSIPVSGTGHDPLDPLVYEGTITNSLGASEGNYAGLVKVTDNYTPGQNGSPLLNGMDGIKRVDPMINPLEGLFEINEFATYQVFSIDVATGIQLILTAPNGGEAWKGLTHENIAWTSTPDIEFIDLYYSKDDFVADNNLIVSNYANSGTYDWYVPNDPSTTVKVKIIESGGTLEDESDDYFTILEPSCDFGTTGFTIAGTYAISGRWTYMGVMVTHQDPTQRLILQGYPANDTLYIQNADDPNGPPVASYNTGDLIYCNCDKAFWVDSISEPGIDRIIYNNFGSGSPTVGYQLKTIDWDGSQFTNPQVLPKHSDIQLQSLWNLCVMPDGDLIYHNANTLTPSFLRRDKSDGYSITFLFTMQQSTCDFGQVGYIRDIAYDSMLDAVILFVRNTDVSNDGQVFVLDMSGNLLFQDIHVFGGTLISYNASVDIDINDPTCRVVVYAGNDIDYGPYWIGRYSGDFDEKTINEYSGVQYGPARGELCADGTLWASWANGSGIQKFNMPSDW